MVEVASGSAGRPEVVLLCGVAGSGKTTYALRLADDGYERLSIDQEIWARFGRYGIDYDPASYGELSDLAEEILRERLRALVAEGRRELGIVLFRGGWADVERYDGRDLTVEAPEVRTLAAFADLLDTRVVRYLGVDE